MLVILRENIESLGQIGDVVRVKDGYARNFLLPQNLVLPADESNLKQMEHNKKSLEKKRAAVKAQFEQIAQKMAEFQVTIRRKTGKNERLFGAVTGHDISEELKKGGFELDKGAVVLKEPIKSLGVHPVSVRVHPEVNASVKVWVVKDEG